MRVYYLLVLVTSPRLLEALQFSKWFGQLIVLLMKIFYVFLYFLLIIAVVLIPYGIAIEVILHRSKTHSTWGLFLEIFERPFYNLFGELGIDEIRGKFYLPSERYAVEGLRMKRLTSK